MKNQNSQSQNHNRYQDNGHSFRAGDLRIPVTRQANGTYTPTLFARLGNQKYRLA